MSPIIFAQSNLDRVTTSWPWYLTRASGLVATVLLTLLMITGISMFTGHYFKFKAPLKSWANHRTLGIAFSISVGVHILSLLFDKYISFSIYEIVLPFASGYKHVKFLGVGLGSLGVTLGIFAMYLVIAIVYTSLTDIIKNNRAFWKLVHYASYGVIALVFFHSIMIGTDLRNGFWRIVWFLANIVILGFVGLRLSRAGSLDPKS